MERTIDTAIPPVKLSLDTRLYTPDSEVLMRKRGILKEDETIENALQRTLDSLTEMDTQLNDGIEDRQFADLSTKLVNEGVICFGTPILTNAGREGAITAACTVLPIIMRDGHPDIKKFHSDSYAALDQAVGTGYDLSDVDEPAATLIELNAALDQINTHLLEQNQRPVASMATLRADHPGVIDFVKAKREVDFMKWRFNISLFVTEELFVAAEAGRPWALRDAEGTIVEEIDPNQLLDEIAECAHYCGEPGVLFKDRIDYDNPTPQWEYKSTAPCAEVAMAEGEACQFSYVNVASLVTDGKFDSEEFASAVRVMTRLLDSSVEYTIQNNDSLQLSLVEQKRRVGVGITGYADLLIRLRIPYSSPDALQLAGEISELLDYHSKVESVSLAEKRGAFPAFSISRYIDPEWTQRKMPRSTGVITGEDWDRLFAGIDRHGIRNASTTAMPPTGTSSAIIGSSKSLEPLFELTDFQGNVHRSVRESLEKTFGVHGVERLIGAIAADGSSFRDSVQLSGVGHLETARQISQDAHMGVQANFQSFLDEALAKTINLPNDATKEDVLEAMWGAYRLKLKGLTVFRDNCLTERQGNVS